MSRSLLFIFCLTISNFIFGITNNGDRFPFPPDSPNRLFFIQRSNNANCVVYDANLTGKLLKGKDPVHTYWIRFADKGEKEELTTIQRTLAYGLYTNKINTNEDAYEGYFLAYRKRKFIVKTTPDGPVALFPINGKMQILKRVFVSVDESGFMPSVNYIDLFGKDVVTGKDIFERFKP
ncbi:DUF4833 domain-containing protein [Sandaracinomonas limnophila]|uniref:DUF4833 domain-containing protein n=1 Tax=Sandaracinomonas limnophila TaxID=1862386 RepID=A0A437PTC1_9BACT|nr:DUF4833 domain-containing protein [Sandaracinomonas limnophila]RVU25504.1 DUF4833 domain-containing protein [Sandaracinomonas limnophila]